MTGKEHFKAIVKRQASRCGFRHGDPNPAGIEKLYAYFVERFHWPHVNIVAMVEAAAE
ncbi:MAG: hypothetical protein LBU21_05225 [Treponema sp.]|jgi:hypothetical protein|nr:hypothetical protein [Treponema sp.]